MIQTRSQTISYRIAGLLLALGMMIPAVFSAPVIALDRPIAPQAPAVLAESSPVTVMKVSVPADPFHVRVDGVPMTTDPRLTTADGVLYVSLRSVAAALLPSAHIAWDGTAATVTCPGVLELSAVPGQSYITANGRCLYVPGTVLAQRGSVLVPLDVLCRAMDATYTRRANGSLELTRGAGGILPGDAFYDETELYWLSHIIHAESGNQPLEGKLAVGNVVLNRKNDSRFPNTIKGVIFQKNQFSPAASGSIYREPNAESVLAAKLCLDGAVSLENVLYFNRVGLRCWASRNRAFVATIAGHTFYA